MGSNPVEASELFLGFLASQLRGSLAFIKIVITFTTLHQATSTLTLAFIKLKSDTRHPLKFHQNDPDVARLEKRLAIGTEILVHSRVSIKVAVKDLERNTRKSKDNLLPEMTKSAK